MKILMTDSKFYKLFKSNNDVKKYILLADKNSIVTTGRQIYVDYLASTRDKSGIFYLNLSMWNKKLGEYEDMLYESGTFNLYPLGKSKNLAEIIENNKKYRKQICEAILINHGHAICDAGEDRNI